jgi:D-alanine-D-alanine ligase
MESDNKLRVGIIFGGRSGEHEVSLMSARSVLDVIDKEKYDVYQVGITHEGVWLSGENVINAFESEDYTSLIPVFVSPNPENNNLHAVRVANYDKGEWDESRIEYLTNLDIVFPVLHGTYGEDGTLQGLLEMADLAYVGAGVVGSAVGMDKGIFSDVMKANKIPVVTTIVVTREQVNSDIETVIEQAEAVSQYPLFVKPANLGSSVGVSKCSSRSDLLEGLIEASRYDRRILIQRSINAREIEVSVLGNSNPKASVPGEVIPSREFYSYEAKYIDDMSELLIPAPIPHETAELARHLAVNAYIAIDCAGMARVDFLLEKDNGDLYLNEVNTIPGFTQISMYPKLWDATGLPYKDLIDELIRLGIQRRVERDQTEWRYQIN